MVKSLAQPSTQQVLASSSIWVAAALNLLPGLGTGYIYQRRWKAYWMTCFFSAFWVVFRFLTQVGLDINDPVEAQSDSIGFYGLLIISIFTACEAGLATKNARENC